MSEAKPGRGSDQFPLRLPDGMRDTIKEVAAENKRSMNAEIIALIEEGLASRLREAPEIPPSAQKADIKIELDTNGIPVSVNEAMLHLSNLVSKSDLETISIEMDIGMRKDPRTKDQSEDDFFRILSTYRILREADDK